MIEHIRCSVSMSLVHDQSVGRARETSDDVVSSGALQRFEVCSPLTVHEVPSRDDIWPSCAPLVHVYCICGAFGSDTAKTCRLLLQWNPSQQAQSCYDSTSIRVTIVFSVQLRVG